MNLRHALTVAALVLVPALAVSGCSSGTPTRHPASTSVADPVGRLVVADVPSGFTERTDAASQSGVTDLAAAARDDAQPGARSALLAERFQRGYQRLWTDAAGDVIAVQVYRYATADGAVTAFRRATAIARRQAQHVAPFDVPAATESHLQGYEVDVEGNRTEQVFGVSGRYGMQLTCTSRSYGQLQERAVTLAQTQYRTLGS